MIIFGRLYILKGLFNSEFQEKVDEYHRLQEIALASRDNSKPNEIKKSADETPSFLVRFRNCLNSHVIINKWILNIFKDPNTLDGKSKELKKNYERLHRIALNSHPRDFEEPKVDGKLI